MNSYASIAETLTSEQGLIPEEREQGRLYLQQTQAGIVGAIKGLSSTQWTFVAVPEQWSIAQIVDHAIFVLERVSGPVRQVLAQAPAPPPDRDYKLVDAIIINQFSNRLAKFSAPGFALPSGRFGSASDALNFLTSAYNALAEFLDSTLDLRNHVMEAMPLKAVTKGQYDVMDGYQWILAAAAHTERHTKQILEVRSHEDFPVV